MFKRFFSFSNPLGIAFTAAALLLTLSPQARKGTRKALVKGAAALLSVGDQVKGLTTGARKELGTMMEEAKIEKEQMVLPDFSDMLKNAGETTKSKMTQVFDDMKFTGERNMSGAAHSMEMGEEFIDHSLNHMNEAVIQKKVSNSKKITKKMAANNKNPSATRNVHNVLSDKTFNTFMGKPPIQ